MMKVVPVNASIIAEAHQGSEVRLKYEIKNIIINIRFIYSKNPKSEIMIEDQAIREKIAVTKTPFFTIIVRFHDKNEFNFYVGT